MAFIELKDVTYRYPFTKTPALEHMTYSFEKGKFYGIIGENGGGKTSLCNLVRGLIPHFYSGELEGECLINGVDVRDCDTDELSVEIGYVFQNPFTQISGVKETVFEEIAMGLENLGVEKSQIAERVKKVCEQLSITDLLQKNPNELSGGQRQRIAFASVIVMDADTLVIDEPTSQLDPEGTRNVFEIINMLKQSGKTILLVEHKIDLIAQYCDEVLVIEKGHIAFQGPANEVLSNEELVEHGAMIPQVAKCGHDMARAGKSLPHIPITISDMTSLLKERLGEQ